jgi:hypothetical protein
MGMSANTVEATGSRRCSDTGAAAAVFNASTTRLDYHYPPHFLEYQIKNILFRAIPLKRDFIRGSRTVTEASLIYF